MLPSGEVTALRYSLPSSTQCPNGRNTSACRLAAAVAVADLLLCLQVCKEVQAGSGKLLKDFVKALEGNAKVADIRERVEAFAASFPMPGFDMSAHA